MSLVFMRAGPKHRTTNMNSSRFEVRAQAPHTATRPNGICARAKLLDALRASDTVIVDMEGVVLTPSFADEFLGALLVEVGEEAFRRSVRIVNVPESARPLLSAVLRRRASTSSNAGEFRAVTG